MPAHTPTPGSRLARLSHPLRAPGLLIAGLAALGGACAAPDPVPDCPAGQQRLAGETPCVPEVPPGPCPAGTRGEPGRRDCVPVGPAGCGPGFEVAPSGWGCSPVLPEAACTGATREALGEVTCAPIGDCGAAFPPPEAALWVDDDLAESLLDATHLRTIGEALAAAPAGAVIAVERGVYREALTFARDVVLRGRCAAEVLIENPGVMAAGLRLSVAARVEVQGVTVRGHRDGALVTAGELELREVLLEANQEAGVVAYRGDVRLQRSAVRGTLPLADGSMGRGLDVEAGGTVAATDSVLAGNTDAGAYVSGSGSRLTLQRSVLRDTAAGGGSGHGRGVIVRAGAGTSIADSAVLANRDIGVFIAAATAELQRSVVADTAPGPGGYFGQAIELQQGGSARIQDCSLARNRDRAVVVNAARLELLGSVIVDTASNTLGDQGLGLFVAAGGEVLAEDVALVANQGMGAGVLDAQTRLTLRRSLVADSRPDAGGAYGHGLAIVLGPQVVLEQCELRDNTVTDLFAVDQGVRVQVQRSWIHGARPGSDGLFGFGALAIAGAHLELVDSRLEEHAGLAVGFAEASGVLQRVVVRSSPVGLQVQGGSRLEEVAAPPDSPAAATVYVTADSVFWDNATRLGGGELPLPAVPTL